MREKSEATIEKFQKKIEKFLLKTGATKVVDTISTSTAFQLETVAGKLTVTLHEPRSSQVLSIFSRFEDAQKAINKGITNTVSGKFNFYATNEKRITDDFQSFIASIALEKINVTFTVKIKNPQAPEFIKGEGAGVLEKQFVTFLVSKEERTSPMFAQQLQEKKEEMLKQWVEVTVEEGNHIKTK